MSEEMSSVQVIFRAQASAGVVVENPLAPWRTLAGEFSRVAFASGATAYGLPSVTLAAEQWGSQLFNFYELDGQLDALAESQDGPFALVLRGGCEETVREVLTRCQRWMNRRNEASRDALFDRVLRRHREAHDLAKPLVRADYNHALDTWQWVLRLAPDAGLAVQLAALFHDVERLVSEADARIEQHAVHYQTFKTGHAARGAELAEGLLAEAGVDAGTRRQVGRLIAAHESPAAPGDPDVEAIDLLNDADALSFFSLNSVGYLDYYGPEQTRKKVTYTLRRLRPAAHRHLAGMRLPAPVMGAIAEEVPQRAA
jgi:hypothetical protein